MAHHGSVNARRVNPKPREKGAATGHVHHDRRHKSIEGKYGVIGQGATITGATVQTTEGGGDPTNYYPGIVYDENGLRAYNSGGTLTMEILAADGTISVFGSGTITGSVIQTSASNPRTVMDSSGIRSYDALGNNTFNLAGGSLTVSGTSTITGGTIQTSTTNPRIILNTSGLSAYNSSGAQVVFIDSSSGAVTITGNLTVTGTSTITGGTFQTSTSNPKMVMNSSGLNAFNGLGANTFSLGADGTLTVSGTSTITGGTFQTASGTGARVVINTGGLSAYDATNTRQVLIDATTGLIQAKGILTAQPGSTVPWQTTGFYIGGGNLLSNSSAEDPTTTSQLLYMSTGSAVTAGTFTLQYGSGTITSSLNWNATAAQVQTALQASGVLPAGFSVSCSGGPLPSAPIVITLSNTQSPAPTVIVVATQSLTGGSAVVGQSPPAWVYTSGVLDAISLSTAFHGGKVFRLTGAGSMQQAIGPYGLKAGIPYSISAYFKAPSATRTAQITVTFQDISGNTVASFVTISSWNMSTDWQRLVNTQTVPVFATRQQIAIGGSPTGGNFQLTYNGQTTTNIAWNATAATVLSALQALSNVGSSGVAVATGGPLPGTPVMVSFVSPPAAAPATMTSTNTLTGGSSPGVVVTNQQAVSVQAAYSIPSGASGEVYYVDGAQVEVGDAPTAYAPRPDEIVANTVQANMINVSQLSAISANLGTITAGTVTGATVQTATSGARMVMNSSGITGFDGSGNTTISLAGGTNTITGATLQTAGSGARIILDGPNDTFHMYNSSNVEMVRWDSNFGLCLTDGTYGNGEIVWGYQQATGAAIASIAAFSTTGSVNRGTLLLQAMPHGNTNTNQINLQGSSDADTANYLQVTIYNAARSVSHTVNVLNGSNQSDFYRSGDSPTFSNVTVGSGAIFRQAAANADSIMYYSNSSSCYLFRGSASGRTELFAAIDSGGASFGNTGFEGGAFVVASDRSLKANITSLTPSRALETIRSLRGIKHSWVGENPSRREYGYVAQEVDQVVPEVVGYGALPGAPSRVIGTIDYMRLLPLHTEAVKHLADRVEDLEYPVMVDPVPVFAALIQAGTLEEAQAAVKAELLRQLECQYFDDSLDEAITGETDDTTALQAAIISLQGGN